MQISSYTRTVNGSYSSTIQVCLTVKDVHCERACMQRGAARVFGSTSVDAESSLKCPSSRFFRCRLWR